MASSSHEKIPGIRQPDTSNQAPLIYLEPFIYRIFGDNEENTITYMAYGMMVAAILAFIQTSLYQAPYGRYTSAKYGRLINGQFAWFVQELPAFAIPFFLVFYSDAIQLSNPVNLACVGMFTLHYFQRTFVFPLLIRGGKPTPLQTFLVAVVFCVYNGYLQGRYQTQYAVYDKDYIHDPKFAIGCILFFLGMAINIHSDHILRNLRKPGETGYKIPRGGMFNFISGGNFFGESLEWIGYAIACWNIPAASFALFTVCNIGPRAYHHHQYYKQKMDNYPKDRKAFIPFIL